jgi:hypothetical protein
VDSGGASSERLDEVVVAERELVEEVVDEEMPVGEWQKWDSEQQRWRQSEQQEAVMAISSGRVEASSVGMEMDEEVRMRDLAVMRQQLGVSDEAEEKVESVQREFKAGGEEVGAAASENVQLGELETSLRGEAQVNSVVVEGVYLGVAANVDVVHGVIPSNVAAVHVNQGEDMIQWLSSDEEDKSEDAGLQQSAGGRQPVGLTLPLTPKLLALWEHRVQQRRQRR